MDVCVNAIIRRWLKNRANDGWLKGSVLNVQPLSFGAGLGHVTDKWTDCRSLVECKAMHRISQIDRPPLMTLREQFNSHFINSISTMKKALREIIMLTKKAEACCIYSVLFRYSDLELSLHVGVEQNFVSNGNHCHNTRSEEKCYVVKRWESS